MTFNTTREMIVTRKSEPPLVTGFIVMAQDGLENKLSYYGPFASFSAAEKWCGNNLVSFETWMILTLTKKTS